MPPEKTAEEIVCALAAAEPLSEGLHYACHFCDAGGVMGRTTAAEDHEDNCPWRQAVEWVEKRAADAA